MNEPLPTRSDFERLVAQGYNRVPLIARLPVGGLTPAAIVAAAPGRDRVLLESTRVSEQDGRYSIVVTQARHKLTAKGDAYVLDGEAGRGDPMRALRGLMARYRGYRPEGAPLFCGGAVGYLAYECNRYFEALPAHRCDDLAIPDVYLLVADRCVVVDHVAGEILLIASGDDYDACAAGVDELAGLIERAAAGPRPPARAGVEGELAPFRSNFARPDYEAAVRRVQEYVRSGDVYQVNLSQRLEVPVRSSGFELYETLSKLNPVHFASYLDLDGFEIVSASPERLVRLEGGRLATRPIAGTRRRGTPEEEERFVRELKTDVKEVSEHAMLVDLERNDLGRVSAYGTVKVTKLMEIIKYAHVMHIESEVEGRLGPGKDFVDVIGATFPGGTITGVPKVRTMEVIAELEPNARGIYTGSVGYISFAGDLDLNIVIRTILLKDGTAYVNVGGGVVWDSVPEREYKETLNKARSQLTALCQHGASS
jgi:para-aminobenzoate synthetase component 1